MCHSQHVNVSTRNVNFKCRFIDQNIRQRENLVEINFEVLEVKNRNILTDTAQRVGVNE